MPLDTPFDVFLSHSSKDERVVDRLHALLEGYRLPRSVGGKSPRRLKVFHFRHDQTLSDSLRRALRERLAECDQLVLAASGASADAPLVEYEISCFLEDRPLERLHIVLVDDEMPQVVPPSLRQRLTDPIYVDLRSGGCSRFRWLILERARSRRRLIPLLAKLHGIRPNELVRRQRRRDRRRRTVIAIATLLALSGIGGLIFRSPSSAWMPTAIEGLDIEKGAFWTEESGTERIRVILKGEVYPGGEEIRLTRHVVLDLDVDGRINGSLVYTDRNGGVPPEFEADPGFAPYGTLADERGILEQVADAGRGLLWNEVPAFLFRRAAARLDFGDGTLSAVAWPKLDADRDFDFRAAFMNATGGDVHKLYGLPVHKLDSRSLLIFVDAGNLPNAASSSKKSARPFRSDDRGRTWRRGTDSGLVASGVTGVIKASTDGSLLYLTTRDTFLSEDYLGRPGGVYRSTTGGLSWERMDLPQQWKDWPSFSSIAVDSLDPTRLAIAVDPYVEKGLPHGGPGVLESGDAGRTWTLLDNGLKIDRQGRIHLLGIGGNGNIIALAYPNPSGWFPESGGRLVIWRELSLLERLLGRYGVSF